MLPEKTKEVFSTPCCSPSFCVPTTPLPLAACDCFLFGFLSRTVLVVFLSLSQEWVSWGLLAFSTPFIAHPNSLLEMVSALYQTNVFLINDWIPICLLFYRVETTSRIGFLFSGVSKSFLTLISLHKMHNAYWSKKKKKKNSIYIYVYSSQPLDPLVNVQGCFSLNSKLKSDS